MSSIIKTAVRRETLASSFTLDAVVVLGGSLVVAACAQLYIKLPFTPVPATGQTFAVLLLGGALGALRGGASLLVYVSWIAAGLPFAAEGKGGAELLGMASASGGYLWGFVAAALVVGWLAERGWTRTLSSALGAMFVGSLVIYVFGVTWLAAALDVPVVADGAEFNDALEFGLYPFVVGDALKLLLAAAALPLSRRWLPAAEG